ncbi:MAG: hypothetical protein AB7P14_10845 [Blastocatellales bacterium]
MGDGHDTANNGSGQLQSGADD